MRIATLIIGLLVGLLLFLQSFTVGIFSDTTVIDDATATAGGAGLFMALIWLLASALVVPFPLASFILFLISAPIGMFTPTGEFEDLRFHGFVAALLAIMALLGWRGKKVEQEKRKERAQQAEREARMEDLMRQQLDAQRRVPCPSRGQLHSEHVRFHSFRRTDMSIARGATS